MVESNDISKDAADALIEIIDLAIRGKKAIIKEAGGGFNEMCSGVVEVLDLFAKADIIIDEEDDL
ncbi:hypothetical protein D3C85_392720 [compost metagenome]